MYKLLLIMLLVVGSMVSEKARGSIDDAYVVSEFEFFKTFKQEDVLEEPVITDKSIQDRLQIGDGTMVCDGTDLDENRNLEKVFFKLDPKIKNMDFDTFFSTPQILEVNSYLGNLYSLIYADQNPKETSIPFIMLARSMNDFQSLTVSIQGENGGVLKCEIAPSLDSFRISSRYHSGEKSRYVQFYPSYAISPIDEQAFSTSISYPVIRCQKNRPMYDFSKTLIAMFKRQVKLNKQTYSSELRLPWVKQHPGGLFTIYPKKMGAGGRCNFSLACHTDKCGFTKALPVGFTTPEKKKEYCDALLDKQQICFE